MKYRVKSPILSAGKKFYPVGRDCSEEVGKISLPKRNDFVSSHFVSLQISRLQNMETEDIEFFETREEAEAWVALKNQERNDV